jgi:hypothetical protein
MRSEWERGRDRGKLFKLNRTCVRCVMTMTNCFHKVCTDKWINIRETEREREGLTWNASVNSHNNAEKMYVMKRLQWIVLRKQRSSLMSVVVVVVGHMKWEKEEKKRWKVCDIWISLQSDSSHSVLGRRRPTKDFQQVLLSVKVTHASQRYRCRSFFP